MVYRQQQQDITSLLFFREEVTRRFQTNYSSLSKADQRRYAWLLQNRDHAGYLTLDQITTVLSHGRDDLFAQKCFFGVISSFYSTAKAYFTGGPTVAAVTETLALAGKIYGRQRTYAAAQISREKQLAVAISYKNALLNSPYPILDCKKVAASLERKVLSLDTDVRALAEMQRYTSQRTVFSYDISSTPSAFTLSILAELGCEIPAYTKKQIEKEPLAEVYQPRLQHKEPASFFTFISKVALAAAAIFLPIKLTYEAIPSIQLVAKDIPPQQVSFSSVQSVTDSLSVSPLVSSQKSNNVVHISWPHETPKQKDPHHFHLPVRSTTTFTEQVLVKEYILQWQHARSVDLKENPNYFHSVPAFGSFHAYGLQDGVYQDNFTYLVVEDGFVRGIMVGKK